MFGIILGNALFFQTNSFLLLLVCHCVHAAAAAVQSGVLLVDFCLIFSLLLLSSHHDIFLTLLDLANQSELFLMFSVLFTSMAVCEYDINQHVGIQ